MNKLTLYAAHCVTRLPYFTMQPYTKIKSNIYLMVFMSMLVSLGVEAQINLTATDATCLQNGELSWMPPADAPAGSIISYTIDDGMGNLTNLDATMFSGLTAGTYTVTPFVDGVAGTSETVDILDAFEPLAFNLSTSNICGLQIDVEVTNGTLADIQILSGGGTPEVSADLTAITGVIFPEMYELLFIDDCGNTIQQDYTMENVTGTQTNLATGLCRIGMDCDSVSYTLSINRLLQEEQPVTFDYTANNPDGTVETGSATVFGTSTVITIPFACGQESDFDFTATLACGAVLPGRGVLNSQNITVVRRPMDCLDCVALRIPFFTGGLSTITFENAPAGSDLIGTDFTQTPTSCEGRTLVVYEICPEPGETLDIGAYTVRIDNECCSRTKSFSYGGPINPTYNRRYSCEEGEGILQISGVVAESITFSGANGVTADACIDGLRAHSPSLPAGVYDITTTDTCGNTITESFNIEPLVWPLGIELDLGCGTFDLAVLDEGEFEPIGSTNFSGTFTYFLEFESSPGVFTELDRSNSLRFGSAPNFVNITEIGNFRVRRVSGPYSCGDCEDVINFTQTSDGLDFETLEGIQCSDGGSFLINASSTGNPDFTYEVFDAAGVTVGTGVAGNGENFIFDDLAGGIYTVEASNQCGSQIREIELIDLPPLMIAGDPLYCEGSDVILSIDNFSFLDYEWTFNGNVVGNMNTLEITNVQASYAGTYTAVVTSPGNDCVNSNLSFDLVVQPIVDPVVVNCYDEFQFNESTCTFENIGTQPEMPPMVNCYDSFEFNNMTCAWDNIGIPPVQPPNVNCYDDFQLNPVLCVYENLGGEPIQPPNVNCYDDYQLDEATCTYINEGSQPEMPPMVNCYDSFEFNNMNCAWDNIGIPPVQPPNVNCYDDFQLNPVLCVYENLGGEPIQPPNVNCYDDYKLDDATCTYINEGSQPEMPPMVNCYDSFVFDTDSCMWINTGTPPVQPPNVNCYDDFQLNPVLCVYENVGGEPIQPPNVNCYDDFQLDDATCTFVNVGEQPEMPPMVNCYDSFVFDTESCMWINTGTSPVQPPNVTCYDDYQLDDATCTFVNIGVPPTMPNPDDLECNEVILLNEIDCVFEVVVDSTIVTDPGDVQCISGWFDGFSAGTLITNQIAGVSITGTCNRMPGVNLAMIFDSNSPTGGDTDLGQMNLGNLLIISEDGSSANPDDEALGGVFTFNFTEDQFISYIDLVDIEEAGGTITLLDASGNVINTVLIPSAGNASVQQLLLNTADVRTMVVELAGSGAISDYCISSMSSTPCMVVPPPVTCDGAVTGFQINPQDGNPLQAITEGQVFCAADFESSDVKVRALVSGTHESLFFTYDTPNGSFTKTENVETYDTGNFWATYPGTYTVTAELYSEPNLQGTLCDVQTITFVIEDCTPPCDGAVIGFQINPQDGNPLQDITEGQIFCTADFASSDVKLRALVSGTHESLFFTYDTPNGSFTKTENVETYDTGNFWATYPGTYTVTAELYSEPNLQGTLCDVQTITFVIEDAAICDPVDCHSLFINDGFEQSYGNWNDGGSDCLRHHSPGNGGYNQSDYTIRLRDNSGSVSSMFTDAYDFSSVTDIRVEFSYMPQSMESGEDFMLEYTTNGSNWHMVQSWASGVDFTNGQHYSEIVEFTGNFSNHTRLRIRCDASGNGDYIFVDDVSISTCGNSAAAIVNETELLSDATTYTYEEVSNTTDSTIDIENRSISEMKIYPNPATEILNIKGLNDSSYEVYDITGKRVIRESKANKVDLSNLSGGTYFLRTNDGRVMRFIKLDN
ncbi:T9SS type A sorting domain-containing protein [Saprospiraceae bacterium]|nr:T9SS type A sorting domain-containing protein [Saprospiraceae bacterium]